MSTKTTDSRQSVKSAEAQKAFADHFAELRSRLFWIAATFVIVSAVAYGFREPLIDLILSPLGDGELVYLTPGGGFSFIFQVTMYAGAVVAAPLLVFHLYRFVKPALPDRARRHSFRMLISSMVLMLAGVAFGYFVAIPSALHFLTTFAGDFVSPNLTADSYLGFVMAYLAGLGILFQLPLFLIIWNWISRIPPGGLLNSQRYVVAFSFIAAAIITPTPDFVNQTMVAAPIIVIYQIGVVAVYIMNRKSKKTAAKSKSRRQVVAEVQSPALQSAARTSMLIGADISQIRQSLDVLALSADTSPNKKLVNQTKQPAVTNQSAPRTVAATSVSGSSNLRPIDGFVAGSGRPTPAMKVPTRQAPNRPVRVRRPLQTTTEVVNGCVPSLAGGPGSSTGIDGFAIRH